MPNHDGHLARGCEPTGHCALGKVWRALVDHENRIKVPTLDFVDVAIEDIRGTGPRDENHVEIGACLA